VISDEKRKCGTEITSRKNTKGVSRGRPCFCP